MDKSAATQPNPERQVQRFELRALGAKQYNTKPHLKLQRSRKVQSDT